MKRYKFCVSLSLTVALSQAPLMSAYCADSSTQPVSKAKVPASKAISPHTYVLAPAGNNSTKPQMDLKTSIHEATSRVKPEAVLAQADENTVNTTPIPPVVTGTLDMEEFKSANVIDLKVSQSRTFKSKNKIVRTSISDPSIAEPVVVSENQMVLLGKSPGTATMVLWDDAGNSVAIDLRVTHDFSQLQATLREIDPRIVLKTYAVGGSDRVILLGDVDHPESVVRAFAAANVFMDDRGMSIQVANNRLITARIGETGGTSSGQGGGSTGQLSQLSSVDRYTFFPNTTNNISRAQLITSDGGRVTSLLKVRKVPLIVLHVTFLEMNTATARALGVQLGLNLTTPAFAFGIGGSAQSSAVGTSGTAGQNVVGSGTPLIFNGAAPGFPGAINTFFRSTANVLANEVFLNDTAGNPIQGSPFPLSGVGQAIFAEAPSTLLPGAALFGAPGGVTFTNAATSLLNLFTSSANWGIPTGSMSINPSIQGSIESNRARILAEPTLVTISGERASFLAGGEVPILQQIATAGTSQQSVSFEPFGLRLNMIPVLQENGTINLEISPEERILSSANALEFAGSSTPIDSFTTRKTQTTVELKPGQELYISGLITVNSGRELNKTPLLGEVPVLGALYRSKAFSKNESELVVAVRPEIILPGTPGQLKLPEEIGRVEGPRDTNLFQVEPTVIDERYQTSGRAERVQKTSPTLPEGSPVPDN